MITTPNDPTETQSETRIRAAETVGHGCHPDDVSDEMLRRSALWEEMERLDSEPLGDRPYAN